MPKAQLLDGLIAAYEAGRLLHMTKSALAGLLGSVALRCIDGQVDDCKLQMNYRLMDIFGES